MSTKTSTKTSAKTSAKPATKGTQAKAPAVKLAEREADLGDFKAGDKVNTGNGTPWVVVGPAQGGTTLKLTRKLENGKTESTFRFARNITAA